MKARAKTRRMRDGKALRFAVLAVDVVCLSVRGSDLMVRLMRTTHPSIRAKESLPGGLMAPRETAEQAAMRLLDEKGGIKNQHVYFEQLCTMSALRRDPTGRVVSVAYLALVPWERLSLDQKKDAPHAWWEKVSSARDLAYDHDEILSISMQRLCAKVGYTTIIRNLLPREFTLTEFKELFELITGRSVDKRNFRRKIAVLAIVEKTPHIRRSTRNRPASLWKFQGRRIKHIEIL